MRPLQLFMLMGFLLLAQVSHCQDEVKQRNNEVGINFIPLIQLAYSANFPLEYNLSFRHALNEKYAFRSSLRLQLDEYVGFIGPHYSRFFREEISISGDETTYRSSYYQRTKSFAIQLGIERCFQLKRTELYAGASVSPGLVLNRSNNYFETFVEDESGYEQRVFSGIDNTFTYSTFEIGVNPYVGWRVPIAKRFVLSMQTATFWTYHFLKYRTDLNAPVFKAGNGKLTIFPLIGEVSLNWKI